MDGDKIIEIKNVGMCFRMSSEKIDSFKDYFIKTLKRKITYNHFWALKDVSFDVKRGESVGLVGLNGSGKSTLLKIIAGVLKPTEGEVIVKGSVAPLIELGAGFDGDLTARENVYLNGALLGHTRKEMESYYEDIVNFSELEMFMNTPVKNFSSGMIARLGFSIATIGRPDILIVDEALAVGDFLFQEKCEKRIGNMLDKGTTILFVAHDTDKVKKVCQKAVWLEKGHVKKIGTSEEICDEYEE